MSLKYVIIFIAIIYSINGCLKTKPKKSNIMFTEEDRSIVKDSNNKYNTSYRRDKVAVETASDSSKEYNNPYPNNTLEEEVSTNTNLHLQIEAVEDYKLAKKIRESLELKLGQFSYIKRGRLNKIVIGGINSEEEANFLRDTQYPGSFIVYPENNKLENNYSTNDDDNAAYETKQEDNYYTGIAIQIGAFRDKSTAERVSNNYRGSYKTKIIKAVINSITLYKVLIIGFPTREEAEKEKINSNLIDSYITYI